MPKIILLLFIQTFLLNGQVLQGDLDQNPRLSLKNFKYSTSETIDLSVQGAVIGKAEIKELRKFVNIESLNLGAIPEVVMLEGNPLILLSGFDSLKELEIFCPNITQEDLIFMLGSKVVSLKISSNGENRVPHLFPEGLKGGERMSRKAGLILASAKMLRKLEFEGEYTLDFVESLTQSQSLDEIVFQSESPKDQFLDQVKTILASDYNIREFKDGKISFTRKK